MVEKRGREYGRVASEAERRRLRSPPMRRRTPRLLPHALPERGALAALLVAWLLGVVAPAFHDHADHAADSGTAAHHDAEADGSERCSGVMVAAAPFATLAASCPDAERCSNPFHHHHSHEAPRHDVASCPTCAALLARAIVPTASFSLPPRAVRRVALPAERAALPSERCVIAQARGPPAVARPLVTRDRSSSTAALRA